MNAYDRYLLDTLVSAQVKLLRALKDGREHADDPRLRDLCDRGMDRFRDDGLGEDIDLIGELHDAGNAERDAWSEHIKLTSALDDTLEAAGIHLPRAAVGDLVERGVDGIEGLAAMTDAELLTVQRIGPVRLAQLNDGLRAWALGQVESGERGFDERVRGLLNDQTEA